MGGMSRGMMKSIRRVFCEVEVLKSPEKVAKRAFLDFSVQCQKFWDRMMKSIRKVFCEAEESNIVINCATCDS